MRPTWLFVTMSLLTSPNGESALVATNSSFTLVGTAASIMLMACFSTRTHLGFCNSKEGSMTQVAR